MIATLLHRPYVFALLALFLLSSIRARGIGRSAAFLAWGYLVAWASEALSIRTGFPYGLYHYNPAAFPGELTLAGVPVFDSVSYTFMVYAAYCAAHLFSTLPGRVILITATLTTVLDIIVDPLAVHGDEWFLGPIFRYETPGCYFGVPLSNFAGWFGVAAVIAAGYWAIETGWGRRRPAGDRRAIREGTLLYFLIGLFNVAITAEIGRWGLAAASTGWLAAVAVVTFWKRTP